MSSPIFKAALPWSLRPIAWLVPSVPHLQLRWAFSLPKPVTLSPCRLQCHPRKPVLRAAWGAENTPLCLLLCFLIVVSSSVELHVALILGPASLGKQPWSVQHPVGKMLPSVFPNSFSTEMSGLCCAGLGPLWGCLMLGHPGGGGRKGCACCYGNTLLRSWTYFICRQFQDESISSPTPSLLLIRVSPQPSVIFPPPHSTSDILLAECPPTPHNLHNNWCYYGKLFDVSFGPAALNFNQLSPECLYSRTVVSSLWTASHNMFQKSCEYGPAYL